MLLPTATLPATPMTCGAGRGRRCRGMSRWPGAQGLCGRHLQVQQTGHRQVDRLDFGQRHPFVQPAQQREVGFRQRQGCRRAQPRPGRAIEVEIRSVQPQAFLEVVGVDRDVALPLLGHFVEREDRLDRARRHAGAAVDALVGIDVQHLRGLECRFVLAGMDAIDRTDVHARGIFGADARLGNNVGHSLLPKSGTRTSIAPIGRSHCITPGVSAWKAPRIQPLHHAETQRTRRRTSDYRALRLAAVSASPREEALTAASTPARASRRTTRPGQLSGASPGRRLASAPRRPPHFPPRRGPRRCPRIRRRNYWPRTRRARGPGPWPTPVFRAPGCPAIGRPLPGRLPTAPPRPVASARRNARPASGTRSSSATKCAPAGTPQIGRVEAALRAVGHDRAEFPDRVGPRRERRRERRARTAAVHVPEIKQRARRERGAIVSVEGAARLVRFDAARHHDKPPGGRHQLVAAVHHRHVRVHAQPAGAAREDCRVVLAAAVGAHAARPREGAKRQAVLGGAQVTGQVQRRADRLAPVRPVRQPGALDQGRGDADDQRARTAHARRPGQVARDRDVGAQPGARKVGGQPPRRHCDVPRPPGELLRRVERVHRHLAAVARASMTRTSWSSRDPATTAKPRGTAASSDRPPA